MDLRESVYEIVLHSKGSMNMKIIKVVDDEEKKKITRAILEALPECSCAVKKHKNKTGTDSRPALFRKARA